MYRKAIISTNEQRAIGHESIARFVNRVMPMSDPDMELLFSLLQNKEVKRILKK